MSQLRIRYPALRYRGGKWRIAPWVIANLPPHECYVEPFAGGASVLLRKPPAEFECLNDLEGDVVAFWRVLRERPHELIAQILTTPFSREELARCQEPVNGNLPPPAADLERARRLWARCYQGRGSSARKSGWRFQMTNQHMRSKFHVHHARAAQRIHGLVDIAVRLTNVQIERATVGEAHKARTEVLWLNPAAERALTP
jgi:site-specific DNA-adenine methylase